MFIVQYLQQLWMVLTELAPWLFFGAGLAGLLKLFLPQGFITKHMGGTSWKNIVKTTLLGIPLPLCSCGVLPTTIGLKKDGASNGSTVGFLISTPQTGVDSIIVTAFFLGWPLAIFKVIAALITGILGGFFVHFTDPDNTQKNRPASQTVNSNEKENMKNKFRWNIFWNYTINELIGSIYKYLVIGLLVAAAISTLFPTDTLAHIPALQGIRGMLFMLIFAIPIYICTTGSVPIAASLIAAGLPIGSALVFLIAGPATNIATLTAVYHTFGRRITAIYLGTVILGSIGFGLLFQFFFSQSTATILLVHHGQVSIYRLIFDISFALLLSGLILRWIWLDFRSWLLRLNRPAATEEELTLQIEGMTCNNCLTHVQHALQNFPNIRSVDIHLATGITRVKGQGLDKAVVSQAVQAAGYSVKNFEKRGCL